MALPRSAGSVAQPTLVLRRFPYGESSLVLHVLTPERGRAALLAKGAYRPSSGFFAVFDLFDTLEVTWRARASEELGLVSRAVLRTRRNALAGDLERYRVGLSLLEVAHATAREGHEERFLYRHLEGSLDLLQRGRATPVLVGVVADLGLLRANGLAPALTHCAICGNRGEDSPDLVPFSIAMGGRLCAACTVRERAQARAVQSLPASVLRVAMSLLEASPAMLERIQVDAGLLERVRAFVEHFLEYHLETRLRSRPKGNARPRSR